MSISGSGHSTNVCDCLSFSVRLVLCVCCWKCLLIPEDVMLEVRQIRGILWPTKIGSILVNRGIRGSVLIAIVARF